MKTVLILASSLAYVPSGELTLLYDFYKQGGEIVAKSDIADALKAQMKDPRSIAMTSYLTKITSAVGHGAVYSTSLDVETLFMDDYQGELAAFWEDVLKIGKLNRGYFVQGEEHALLYSIETSPVSFDVDIRFAYEGAKSIATPPGKRALRLPHFSCHHWPPRICPSLSRTVMEATEDEFPF